MKRYLRKLKYEFTSYKAEPKIIPTHFDREPGGKILLF